jgi:RNA-binding protein PNO1
MNQSLRSLYAVAIDLPDQEQEHVHAQDQDQELSTSAAMQIDEDGAPRFPPASASASAAPPALPRVETRKVPIPPHRFSWLRANWTKMYPPLVSQLKLQVRMNVRTKSVELRTSKHTVEAAESGEAGAALQKGEDFIRATALGFDVDVGFFPLPRGLWRRCLLGQDAIAFLRLDGIFLESFEFKDIKTLNPAHLSRAIGRVAGKDGRTIRAIMDASKTRIVLADSKVHIMGSFQNIRIARETVVSLVLGAPPGKIYNNLRIISRRMKESF